MSSLLQNQPGDNGTTRQLSVTLTIIWRSSMLADERVDTATAGIVNRAPWDCNRVFAAALTDTG